MIKIILEDSAKEILKWKHLDSPSLMASTVLLKLVGRFIRIILYCNFLKYLFTARPTTYVVGSDSESIATDVTDSPQQGKYPTV